MMNEENIKYFTEGYALGMSDQIMYSVYGKAINKMPKEKIIKIRTMLAKEFINDMLEEFEKEEQGLK